ncbi:MULTISPECIES: iron-hydroxamate ABC transporter substrate-binding protein [Sporosarcina]|uniref:Iron complex transport system substrate-binding protein n=1 Tax=Sporosarcina newyorkensis TaxID=759851 RepID=A0A1T4YXR9_9BACL|nr:iron-hydroxamate ABC transporter substrate-binding protein [Sporosarcina newyorkensis]SKB06516.1 iron complex transport system substrate-binding protein [Sporosarcina newyorkensis]
MKKFILPAILLLALALGACGNKQDESSNKNTVKEDEGKSDTITYESEDGPVEVPADPQKVVVLASFAGNVMALDVNLIGVDSWSKSNPRFDSALRDVEEVSEENIEKIIELEPDLIIGFSTTKNIDKLKEIAPTVTYTYGKVDYLTQHIEIGKLLNKEEEATKWVEDFKQRAQDTGKKIKEKIGEDSTVSVIENFDKQLYVYGDSWGRGTEILYQEMKLAMPEKVKEMAMEPGYYALSTEVLPEFAGDYMILSSFDAADNSFMETDTYKNIPAVKNNQVFEANGEEFYFNDPLTLEYQLEFFTKHFLGTN